MISPNIKVCNSSTLHASRTSISSLQDLLHFLLYFSETCEQLPFVVEVLVKPLIFFSEKIFDFFGLSSMIC